MNSPCQRTFIIPVKGLASFYVFEAKSQKVKWYTGKMTLKVKRLHPDAKLPTRAHHDDAGLDIYCYEAVTLPPHQTIKVPTGIAYEVPEGYVGLVWDKSSIGGKGIKTLGGVLDSGYRGELFVPLCNLFDEPYTFEAGHKIAQMLIQKVELWEIEEREELSETKRGTGAFGSTGK
jgi:dUTP pyrophosphatase